ncbi:hypothetical protein SmJEL517_g00400 [Synchytrium microbalum]|uniref:F-box domain-containing protein n=1 Tax=Synchytrium microbalum TaxID=1806994 RepID=A0A507CES0_9FUNG|nr:uncharacterized protein SmJEL517_g00400 [Synchytrium microbalum]TPX37981.1 hypothetical protein SmJEL517_g00400 [Synchytrium microbalum]
MILSPRVKAGAQFPPQVIDVNGQIINVKEEASTRILIVITLKAVWCPVCPVLLSLLSFMGAQTQASTTNWIDPFGLGERTIDEEERKFHSLVLQQDAKFMVICPGPRSEILQIRDTVDFRDNCFFVEDVGLSISNTLGIVMNPPVGIWPGILHVKQNCDIQTIELGRGPGHYGEVALISYLAKLRLLTEGLALNNAKTLQYITTTALPSIPQIYDYPARDGLPLEIMELIMEQLCHKDRKTASMVCRSYRTVVSSVYEQECKVLLKKFAEGLPVYEKQFVRNGFRTDSGNVLVKQMTVTDIYKLDEQVEPVKTGAEAFLAVFCRLESL